MTTMMMNITTMMNNDDEYNYVDGDDMTMMMTTTTMMTMMMKRMNRVLDMNRVLLLLAMGDLVLQTVGLDLLCLYLFYTSIP